MAKKKRGRPTKKILEPIPDTFENVLKAVVRGRSDSVRPPAESKGATRKPEG